MPAPELSVVLATPDVETIAPGLEALRAQTARGRIEVVLVSLLGGPLAVDLDGFGASHVVYPGEPVSLAAGRVAGVRASGGRFVHIGETHAFPLEDWAERVLDVLDGPWTAVVSGLENGNPKAVLSWSNLVTDYGPWLAHLPEAEIEQIPPYNTAFERTFALRAAEQHPDAFTGGFDLSGLLRTGGHRAFLRSSARVAHVNVAQPSVWLGQRCVGARARAGRRSCDWPPARRAAYALGTPLIPVVLGARRARPLLAASRAWRLPALTAPAMLIGLAAQACGEFVAFVAGESLDAERRADELEIYKTRYT